MVEYTIVKTQENLRQLKRWVLTTPTVSIDTETINDEIVMLQLGTTTRQWIIDVRQYKDFASEILTFLVKCNTLLVGHNLAYDYRVIKQDFGISIENLFDTMLAAQVLECGLPTKRGHFTLEQTVQRYYDPWAYSNQGYLFLPHVTKKVRDSFAKMDTEEFSALHLTYGALDVYYAYALWLKLSRLLEEHALVATAALEFDFLKVATDMSTNGIPLSAKTWLQVAEKNKLITADLLSRLREVADINWLSWQQVSKVFKERGINVEFIDRKTGQIKDSVSKVALADKLTNPLVKLYLDYRESDKKDGTYGEAFLKHLAPDGRIHSSFWQIKDTGRTSSSEPNCFSRDTEVLTQEGWVRFDNLSEEQLVAQWNNGTVTFVRPLKYFSTHAETLVGLRSQQINMRVTADHRMLLRNRKTSALSVKAAQDFPEDYQHLHAGIKRDGEAFDPYTIRLAVAIQADAELTGNSVRFSFRKRRKYERLYWILQNLGIEPTITKGAREYVRFPLSEATEALRFLLNKQFNWRILQGNQESLTTFMDELFYWDGLHTRKNTYCSKIRANVDVVQAVASLIGWRCRLRLYKNRYWNADLTPRDYSLTTNHAKTEIPYNDIVYCVEVPSSFLVVRCGEVVSISGNCQNIPSKTNDYRDCFIAPDGWTFVIADYSQQEARLLADLSGEQVLQKMFLDGLDYHLETAKRAFQNPNLTKDSPERKLAKNTGFAIAFGGGASTIHARYGVKLDVAKDMVSKYFKTFPRLKEYFDEQGDLARSRGYVLIDEVVGRKSYLPNFQVFKFTEKNKELHPKYASTYRKLHSEYQRIAQNYRPQGSGASISKTAGVYLREYLKSDPGLFEITLLVHDEWLVMCKEENAEKVATVLTDCMKRAAEKFCKSLPIPAEASISKTWKK